jgi:hypothetical protein
MASEINKLWTRVRSTKNEAEAVRGLVKILSSKEGRTFVVGLEPADGVLCIEILDYVRSNPPSTTIRCARSLMKIQALAEHKLLPSERQVFFGTLAELVETHGWLPGSVAITEKIDIPDSGEPCISGGFADIRKGQHNGRTVAVKMTRVQESDSLEKIRKVSVDNIPTVKE